ncbi:MAG TPA: glycoside hydrolase family 38 C-terminal domain-containing protein, partial [Roseiflexaceae bacterium]|nr:glycoside hydrolase family 38 C-terminal domain-containing protein [Roseiflexaceae bacterium]
MMSRPIVHMIGQAHLDPVWLWRWTEGRAEALACSRSAIDRLGEYPAFTFTRGESQVYSWIAEEDPQLLAEIRAQIAAGRWHVVNGMVIQPDMNIPAGESFVRQVLLGKAQIQALLGVEPRVAYCVDSFGHSGTLPQILLGCGFDSYVFMRPGPHEMQLPAQLFWWQGPDGSRILTFRISQAYTTRSDDQEAHVQRAVADMSPAVGQTMCFFGVGDHGGGPTRRQIENIAAIAAARTDLDVRFSSPAAFFDAVRPLAADLPTVAAELQFHAVGCYTAVSAIKRDHRRAENGLLLAERMAALAAQVCGRPYPAAELQRLWHNLCFNQFHDTLGGSAIKAACDDALMDLGRVILGAAELCDDAGRAIAARVDTSGAGGALVVFNPFPQPRSVYVEYEPWTGWQPWQEGRWGLIDDHGMPVAYQQLEPREALTGPSGGISRLLFRTELPPLGYRSYRFGPNVAAVQADGMAQARGDLLENDRLRFTIDPLRGTITSCVDLASGQEFVGPGGWNIAEVLDDRSDTWSHGVRGYGAAAALFGDACTTVASNGPFEASILIERSYGESTWLQQLILRHGEDQLLVRNWLLWQGQWKTLKLAFSVATDAPRAFHDVAYGWCERPCDGAEVPTHMWMDVSGPAQDAAGAPIGAALLNDGRYGCDVQGSTMRLTILRSPPYAYHEPHPYGSRKRYDWIDQGLHEFTLVVRPHRGDWRDAAIPAQARALNMPEALITTHSHGGHLPATYAGLMLDTAELELTAFKQAEDGDGMIVRLADRHGRGGRGMLRWQGQVFAIGLPPAGVATWRLRQVAEAWELTPCD